MKSRTALSVLFIAIGCVCLSLSSGYAQKNAFNLKEGATGTICLGCHEGLKEKMKKPFIHTPVADGDCTGCHNPHTSNFDMMLAAPAATICYTCHDSVIPKDAKSAHKVVADGKCTSCHDPHAADNKMNLLKKGSELCGECHKQLAEKVKGSKYAHPPAREDCLGCHSPHASTKNIKLLEDAPPSLCLKCHETDKPTFKKLHLEYPVEKANCTSCHDPHGSNTAAMLYDNVHEPVAKRKCDQCHNPPSGSEPFSLKAAGYEVCQGCHYDLIRDVLNKARIHWPVVDNRGCMNCHSPHASPQKKLLRQPMLTVCGKCHGDTIARQERATTKHPPVADGECSECHLPHSSDAQFSLRKESVIDVCAKCHEWQTHTTHPIGEEYVDPRNKNLTLQCESCHRAHGTEYNHFIYFSTTNELCVQCHVRFRR